MDDPIQKIKDLADIVELISEIIPVKRSGASYVAVCPFHNDTRPSMHISPAKGIFKCFSCGAGGDVFKFWQDFYQKDFKETLKDLADKYGVELHQTDFDKEKSKNFNLKIQMHQIAVDYYHNLLLASPQAQKARDYLKEREFSTASIADFKIGFSPEDDDWQKLIKIIQEKLKVKEEEIEAAGLASKSAKTGSYYDRFRGRLMIPIFDERSRPIAFGARVLPGGDDKSAKYINSPETDIYHKGSNLFGLNLAKETIRKENSVILVEGFFDLIRLHQAGIKHVVANQGTALTPSQVKQLVRFTENKKIYLCFDTDNAGETASDRAAELIAQILEKFDYELRTVRVPGGKDPDEFVQKNGAEAFRELVSKAPLYIDYKIDTIIGREPLSPFEKNQKIKEIAKYMPLLNSKILVNEYQKIIADKLKLNEEAVRSEINKIIREGKDKTDHQYERKPPANSKINLVNHNGHMIYAQSAINAIEQELILLALRDREIIERFMNEEGELLGNENQKILEAIIEVSFENPDLNDPDSKFKLLMDKLSTERELSKILAEIGIKLEQELAKDNISERYQELLRRIKESRLKKEFAKIKDQLLSHSDDSPEWLAIHNEKIKIEREMQKLRSINTLRQPS